ncbi:MAG: DNA-processing protein DprA [Desulfovibrionaceae bacterium]
MSAKQQEAPPLVVIEKDLPGYPAMLAATLGDKAPAALHARGAVDLLEKPCVGFCGSRNVTEKGLDIARDCAEQAVQAGMVVVSGNARGVDRAAHRAALEHGGTTILVLPEGLDNFRVHGELAPWWDWERTLVLSQFQPGQAWKSWNAMARNKTILGLVQAMIVIEAGEKGGTLDAGKQALRLGVPLFVAHRTDMEQASKGGRMLLEQGGVRLNKSQRLGQADMPAVFRAMRLRCEARNASETHPTQASLL